MTFFLNPKIGLTLILFFLLRIVDADPSFKGVIFIISSLILIYLNQKNYSKKLLVLIFSLFVISFFANEKKKIEELSFPLKMSENSDDIYLGIFKRKNLTGLNIIISNSLQIVTQIYSIVFKNH